MASYVLQHLYGAGWIVLASRQVRTFNNCFYVRSLIIFIKFNFKTAGLDFK